MNRIWLFLIVATCAFGQVSARNPNFGANVVIGYASLPAACYQRQIAVLMTTGTLYVCSSDNTWTAVGGAGGPGGTAAGALSGTYPNPTLAYVATNPQTGTSYAILTGDRNKLVTLTNAAAIAVSIAQAGSAGFPNGWETTVLNSGVGTATITPATSTIEGGATFVLTTGQSARIVSNGTNYRAIRHRNALVSADIPNNAADTSGTAAALSATLTEARFPALDGDVTTAAGDLTTTIGAAKVAPAMMKASTFDAQSDGATITWAIASVLNAQATVTLGGNRTLAITNPVVGGNYVLKLIQDGTGGRTLALGTGCTWKVAGGGSGAVTLTNAANAVDILTFVFDGTSCFATLLPNFN